MRALFDYHPERDSPNLNLEMELSFNAGDTVTVYGVIVSCSFATARNIFEDQYTYCCKTHKEV